MTTEVTVSWPLVTENEEGGTLVSPIAEYQIHWYVGATPIAPDHNGIEVVAPNVNTHTFSVPDGQIGVRMRSKDVQGRVSEFTPYIHGDTRQTPPAAPMPMATFTDV